jgi:hypothetical protein
MGKKRKSGSRLLKLRIEDIEAEETDRLVEEADLFLHLAKFIALLGQKYPECKIELWFSEAHPEPELQTWNIDIEKKETVWKTVASFRINATTWNIVALGDYDDDNVDLENEFNGINLRQVVNPVAMSQDRRNENEKKNIKEDLDNVKR